MRCENPPPQRALETGRKGLPYGSWRSQRQRSRGDGKQMGSSGWEGPVGRAARMGKGQEMWAKALSCALENAETDS